MDTNVIIAIVVVVVIAALLAIGGWWFGKSRKSAVDKATEAAGRMTDDLPEREGFQRMQKNEKKENG